MAVKTSGGLSARQVVLFGPFSKSTMCQNAWTDVDEDQTRFCALKHLFAWQRGKVALRAIREILLHLFRRELTTEASKKPADVMSRELIIQIVVDAYMTM